MGTGAALAPAVAVRQRARRLVLAVAHVGHVLAVIHPLHVHLGHVVHGRRRVSRLRGMGATGTASERDRLEPEGPGEEQREPEARTHGALKHFEPGVAIARGAEGTAGDFQATSPYPGPRSKVVTAVRAPGEPPALRDER